MNEGGELRRESRAGNVESWNHGNEESQELGGHWEAGEETRGGYKGEKENNKKKKQQLAKLQMRVNGQKSF